MSFWSGDGHYKISFKNDSDTNTNSNQTITNISILETLIDLAKLANINNNRKTDNYNIHYETFLPVVLIILFLILLFFIYALNNLDLRNTLKRIICCQCWSSRTKYFNNNRISSYNNGEYYRPGSTYRKSNYSGSVKYYEDQNYYGFNKFQQHIDTVPNKKYAYSNDYERIYAARMDKMILMTNLNGQNRLYHSDGNPYGYADPRAINTRTTFSNIRQFNREPDNYASANYYPVQSEIRKKLPHKSKSKSIDSGLESKAHNPKKSHKQIRLSYSNSKLDHKKWLATLNALNNNLSNDQLPSYSNELSSIMLSTNEIDNNNKTTNKIPSQVTNSNLGHRSSTFKSSNKHETIKTDSTITNVTYTNNTYNNSNKEAKESTFSRLSNKLTNLSSDNIIKSLCKEWKLTNSEKKNSRLNSKYSRLCKSFTFLSQRVTENILPNKKNSDTGNLYDKNHPKSQKSNDKISTSEPAKLSSINKPNQQNYLKNISEIKSNKFMSMNSLLEKVGSVSTWSRHKSDHKIVSDAAVQTSLVASDSSSFNSHATTLQTNNFGTIVANFGSASIKPTFKASFKKNKVLMRTHSEDNCLSNSCSPENDKYFNVKKN